MSIDLARLAGGALVVPENAEEPTRFAADQLAAYLGRMFERPPVRRIQPGADGSWLALTASDRPPGAPPALAPDAEYAVRGVDDAAFLVGARGGSLLAAVYALLEAGGCRWSPHGPAAEHVPGPGVATRAIPSLEGTPAFARRVYAADLATWHYTVPARLAERLPHDVAFVDWMAKSGATGFLFIRHANDTQWVIPELVPELRRRGLAIEGGGHALVELLPRALFAAHPDYFPLAKGGRSDFGNVCVSSQDALAIVRERARTAREAIPGGADFHLWGLDLLGGGWCRCAGCARLPPSDQSLAVCNAAAETVGGVFHLAYHDTIEPPRVVRPHPAVSAEFAPRERCYGHALDDPTCATNVPYRRALEEHLERFAGRVDVFEYYGDAILFGGCAVPLAGVIERDLAYYRAAGVRGVSCLVFGQYSLWAYGVNVEAFARGVRAAAAASDVVRSYCARRFGAPAAGMVDYLSALERTMAAVVTYGDVLAPPLETERAAAGLRAALAEAQALRRLLAAARASASGDAVAAEERLLAYTLDALGAVHDWLAATHDAGEPAIAALFAAAEHVRAASPALTGTWGTYDLEITHHFYAAALRARRSAQ